MIYKAIRLGGLVVFVVSVVYIFVSSNITHKRSELVVVTAGPPSVWPGPESQGKTHDYMYNQLHPSQLRLPKPPPGPPIAALFPVLQPICDAAGGCDKVELVCVKYDGKGNSVIRNRTYYRIYATINGQRYIGVGWTENAKPDCHRAIAQAAKDFWEYVHYGLDESKIIYPDQLPCDGGCFK